MIRKQFYMLITCILILFLIANNVTATVTFTDETNDVFYYENGIIDRENDPHTYTEVPEVDIHSVGFETTTGGTTVFLTVDADIIEDYVDGYDYSIRIYQGNTNDFDYYHLWTDNQNNGWHSWFNSNEHETYSFDGDTLSIFLAGISLDASTTYIEAQAVHYRLDGGMDSDWYPDGVEKQTESNTNDNNDQTEDNDMKSEDQSEGNSSDSTPGFELYICIACLMIMVLVYRRKN